jgi:hypothetical protein
MDTFRNSFADELAKLAAMPSVRGSGASLASGQEPPPLKMKSWEVLRPKPSTAARVKATPPLAKLADAQYLKPTAGPKMPTQEEKIQEFKRSGTGRTKPQPVSPELRNKIQEMMKRHPHPEHLIAAGMVPHAGMLGGLALHGMLGQSDNPLTGLAGMVSGMARPGPKQGGAPSAAAGQLKSPPWKPTLPSMAKRMKPPG